MPSPPPRRLYCFAEFTLSPAERVLRRHGHEVPLIPRYLDLLLLLVERRGDALHRREILERVWSDVVVSDGALSQAVRTLRRALGEDGAGGAFIRTVSRHGYQFVCPVTEQDAGDGAAAASSRDAPAPLAPAATPVSVDPFVAPLARLLAPDSSDETRAEAAVELHGLGTAEALRRLDRQPGHARAWAHLRDGRWDVAGAGPVPLAAAPAGPAAWAALVALRLRRARRLVAARWAAASAGAALAGLLAGLLGALALGALEGAGLPSPSLALGLALVGALVAGLGGAGVGSGLAAAEALVRSWRAPALVVLGAAGGALVALAARGGVDALLAGLFGFQSLPLGGGVEGLAMGAAAGLGYGLATPRPTGGMATPRGAARLRACAATGLVCAAAAALLSAAGLRLGAVSLAAVVEGFPATQVRLAAFGPLTGEIGFGPRTRMLVGAIEGLLFGAGLAAGLTRRPSPWGRDNG